MHFISTADTTETVTVSRRIREKKVDVSAPMAIKNYNKYIDGVDRHDRLRSTFLLGKKLHFKKYYVKLFLFLCDIGFTNAWIYYKMCNPDATKKYGSRADFFESIAEAMVNPNTNWSAKYPVELPNTTENFKEMSSEVLNDCAPLAPFNFPTETCIPVPLDALQIPLSTKIRVCQICNYEKRPYKWKSVCALQQAWGTFMYGGERTSFRM